MRDLLFKNLTSSDRRKRTILSSEITDKNGIRSIIRRHLVCIIKEVTQVCQAQNPPPSIYMLKEHNDAQRLEKFFCRLKTSVFVEDKNRLFIIYFMHSLKITLLKIPQDSLGYA